jgi:hypothetical protein
MFRLFDYFDAIDAADYDGLTRPDVASTLTPAERAQLTASDLPRQKGQTWLFTDGLFDTGLEPLLTSLRGARQEVRLVHILTPAELAPNLSGELRLLDIELGTGKNIAMSAGVLARYQEVLTDFLMQTRAICEQYGITYTQVNTENAVEQSRFEMLM